MTAWGESCGFTTKLTPAHSYIYIDAGQIVVETSDPNDAGDYQMTLTLQSSDYPDYLDGIDYNF